MLKPVRPKGWRMLCSELFTRRSLLRQNASPMTTGSFSIPTTRCSSSSSPKSAASLRRETTPVSSWRTARPRSLDAALLSGTLCCQNPSSFASNDRLLSTFKRFRKSSAQDRDEVSVDVAGFKETLKLGRRGSFACGALCGSQASTEQPRERRPCAVLNFWPMPRVI